MSETEKPVLNLEERVAELELENAGIKKVGLLLVILTILIGLLMVLSVRQIHNSLITDGLIIGHEGQSRTALTVLKPENRQGHLGVLFYDNLGLLPTDLQSNAVPDLDGMVFYDRSGKPRIAIGVDASDQAIIMLTAPDGRVLFRAGLEALPASGESPKDEAAPSASPSPTPAATP